MRFGIYVRNESFVITQPSTDGSVTRATGAPDGAKETTPARGPGLPETHTTPQRASCQPAVLSPRLVRPVGLGTAPSADLIGTRGGWRARDGAGLPALRAVAGRDGRGLAGAADVLRTTGAGAMGRACWHGGCIAGGWRGRAGAAAH